ncbi:hypothetical protein DL96DRAFT_774509 [Flagelloscypha sp. PMI_526]|nr:hypothetical protein DL96DRAFT_774509 [Flagelloscypha sp. PMI_526]
MSAAEPEWPLAQSLACSRKNCRGVVPLDWKKKLCPRCTENSRQANRRRREREKPQRSGATLPSSGVQAAGLETPILLERQCSTHGCKTVIKAEGFKMCPRHRELKRAERERYRERQRTAKQAALTTMTTKLDTSVNTSPILRPLSPLNGKRVLPPCQTDHCSLLRNKTKSGLNTSVIQSLGVSSRVREYQWPSELFRDITTLRPSPSPSNLPSFRGHYSIVSHPDTNNFKRIQQVKHELKSQGLMFSSSTRISTFATGMMRQYKCLCSTRNSCGGRLRISALDDNSHPFLPGQTVVVDLFHP